MENSLQIIINGVSIVDACDMDAETIVATLRAVAEPISRFGMKHALRVLGRSDKLREVLFVEAQAGHSALSTVVCGTSKH